MDGRVKAEQEKILAGVKKAIGDSRTEYPSDIEWERDVFPDVMADIIRMFGRGHARDLFAATLTPTEFHAWEALARALREWPGPGSEVRRAATT